MDFNNWINLISIIITSLFTSFLAYIAYKSMRFYKISALSNVYQQIHEEYSSDEMNDAVKHLHDFKRANQKLFFDNPYSFAHKYINTYKDQS